MQRGSLRQGQWSDLLPCNSDRKGAGLWQSDLQWHLPPELGLGRQSSRVRKAPTRSECRALMFTLLKVKSSTLMLKTLHSEGTEWVSSFGTCYRILLYVKGQGWGGITEGTPSFNPPTPPSSPALTHTRLHKLENHIPCLSLLIQTLHIHK